MKMVECVICVSVSFERTSLMAGRSMFRTKMVECVICVSVSFERTSLMAGRSMFRLWFYFEGFFLLFRGADSFLYFTNKHVQKMSKMYNS